jgi:hypothetical protein
MKNLYQLLILLALGITNAFAQDKPATDPVAENMLLYQRNVGGWPKAVNEVKVDYNKTLTDEQKLVPRVLTQLLIIVPLTRKLLTW